MPDLVLVDGFEAAVSAWSVGGGGLATTLVNDTSYTFDSSIKRSGAYSLKGIQVTGSSHRIVKALTLSNPRMLVGSFYFRAEAAPAASSIFIDGPSGPRPQFRIDTAGTISALYTGGTAITKATSVCDSAWHLIDFKADTSANPYTLDWSFDGAAQTQATRAVAAADLVNFTIGTSGTGPNLTFWLDDLVLSNTGADYPIGEHTVFGCVPSSDGTHDNTSGGMEDNAGIDLTTTAYQLVDNWPPDTAAYIRQSVVDTGDYAEVNFANHDATMDVIWDVQPYLAYTSSTNAINEGGCIVSSDAFSTSTEVYGIPAARTNYQTTTTTGPFYKVSNTATSIGVLTRPGGGWTTSAFDALQARMGYSNDVTGNPRWLALMVQYAGTLGGGGGGSATESVGFIPI